MAAKSTVSHPFGNAAPFAEPPWYTVLQSPYYNDSHRRLRAFVREYLEKYIIPFVEQWEESGEVPREEVLRWAKSGLAFQDVPEKYRPGVSLPAGIPEPEWNIFHTLVLTYEISRMGYIAGMGAGSVIGAPPVVNHGSEDQKQRWLPGLFSGETSFCLGATEPSGGSDLANLKTTAKKTPDGKFYIVNGFKKWITGSLIASHMTTAVRTGGPGAAGVSMLVIPLQLPGVTLRKIKNSGVNVGGSAWVTLENVKVPAENLIGTENAGFTYLMTNFNKERLVLCISMNAQARACLEDAWAYSLDRHTFGQPLFSHQVIRHKLATMARYIESHWAWIEQLAYHIKATGSIGSELSSRIALCKVQGGRLLELANREAQQILGGNGYQRGGVGGRVEQISRDLRMSVVGGGSEEIITDLAVRQEMKFAEARGSKL